MSTAYNMRSGRENKGPPSADLLVCFPPRTHLALMPKPIYSPARPAGEPGTRCRRRHARKLSNRGIFAGGIGHASPLLRAKTNSRLANNSSDISEPTSPKVTCAGQIKINKHKPASCSNWQSVMEEIERLHNSRKQKKRHAWSEAFGLKKDVMQFLTCLRNIRFDFRCFGSFPTSVVDDDDDDDGEEEEEDEYDDVFEDEKFHESIDRLKEETDQRTHNEEVDDLQRSKTVFSKWFMVLQEDHRGGDEYAMNQSSDTAAHVVDDDDEEEEEEDHHGPCVPPPNALLLMRCRSAPLNKWLQEEKDEEKERKKEKERLLVMRCGEDFSKLSTDVAKETWIVGGITTAGMLSRSRSCRR